MKNARRLKGKTIAKVHQYLWKAEDRGGGYTSTWVVAAIEFTDGSFLRFMTVEGDGDYATDGIYPARPVEATS